MDEIISSFLGKIGEHLQDYEVLSIVKSFRVGAYPLSFLHGLVDWRKKRPIDGAKKIDLDEKDMKILRAIGDDTSISLLDVARRARVSPDIAAYRLKQMQRSVILGYIPVINYHKIGYNTYVLLLQIANLNNQKEKKVARFFEDDETTLWAVKTIGRYNVLAYLCVRDINELQKTLHVIRGEFGEDIIKRDSFLTVAEYKYTYTPDCLFEEKN